MARIVEYDTVLQTLLEQGLKSLYYNSGAFGFPADATPPPRHVGWIGPPDETIRPAARPLLRHVPPPFERNLAELAAVAWGQALPGNVWVMPRSHWAYELDFGSREWMPGLLGSVGIDAAGLAARNDGSAIEFAADERDAFVRFVTGLLEGLLGSDFALAVPGRAALCTVHHHKQLWWTTTSADVYAALETTGANAE